MDLIILGSGTCVSGLPDIPDRYPPSFLLKTQDNTLFLIDCSEGVRFRINQAGFEYSRIEYILQSHAHPDHYALIPFLQSVFLKGLWGGNRFRRPAINIFCPYQIADAFPTLWRIFLPETGGQYYAFPEIKFRGGGDRAFWRLRRDLEVFAFETYHGFGKSPGLAFRVYDGWHIFAYSGDTGYCDGVVEAAEKADLFLCEAFIDVGDSSISEEYGHLSPFEAASIAEEARAKKLVLFHYTGRQSDQMIVKDARRSGFQGEIVVAKDFMRISA